MSQSSVSIARQSGPDRFEITIDDEVAGFAEFVDHDGQRIFHHTEIDDRFGGKGFAGKVVAHGLDATRDDGKRIVPVCPYVERFVQKHDDWSDLVDPVTDDAKALVAQQN